MFKAILLATSILIVGCDAMDDMSNMFDNQKVVEDYIKDQHGLEAQVGFNITNGQLTQVSVYYQSNDVRDISIDELEELSLKAVASAFKLTPKSLNLVIQSNPDVKVYESLKPSQSEFSDSYPKNG